MNIKNLSALVLIIISNALFSQQSLNDYKYVTVQKKYDFLNSEDQYQLNSLTKFLFKKEGFTVLFDSDKKSQELANNPCLGVTARVKKGSSMFVTKLVVELVNCRNEIIHTSTEGRSKQKDYKKAYHEAIRKAFKSISLLEYKYNPVKTPVLVEEKTIIEEKLVTVEKEKSVEVVEKVTPVKVGIVKKEPVKEVVEEVAPIEEIEEEIEDVPFLIIEKETTENLLYAQVNPLGFQLVDSTPKVVYILLKSTKKDLYFLKNKNGILYKENRHWIIEYYNLGTLVRKNLNIKF